MPQHSTEQLSLLNWQCPNIKLNNSTDSTDNASIQLGLNAARWYRSTTRLGGTRRGDRRAKRGACSAKTTNESIYPDQNYDLRSRGKVGKFYLNAVLSSLCALGSTSLAVFCSWRDFVLVMVDAASRESVSADPRTSRLCGAQEQLFRLLYEPGRVLGGS